MATLVGVHGIAQQRKGPEILQAEWGPSLRDGVRLAGGSLPEPAFAAAFYGHLFRPRGNVRSVGDAHYRPSDVTADEAQLLSSWLAEASRLEPGRVPSPDSKLRAATPAGVQAALRMLTRSRFFAGIAESAMISDLKQVRLYMRDKTIKRAAQAEVDAVVSAETRVIVAHSLGSVVAYEALHTYAASPRWANVATLVTLGSPLGIRNLIFEALDPTPLAGRGAWPPTIGRWVNISDDGDVVALTKTLRPLFGSALVDMQISNGATAHDVSPYLTARETGEAVRDGLA